MRPDWRAQFPEFAAAVEARCQKGGETYGDRSFSRDVGELLAEIEEELLDVCGWSFVLWCRLRALRDLWTRLSELGGEDCAGG